MVLEGCLLAPAGRGRNSREAALVHARRSRAARGGRDQVVVLVVGRRVLVIELAGWSKGSTFFVCFFFPLPQKSGLSSRLR